MKKAIYLKSIFLLCLLLAGAVSAHADGYDYDCVKVTDLSDVSDGETVLLVDESKNLALSPREDIYGLKGVEIAIGEDNVIRNMPANIIWTIENLGNDSFSFKNNGDYLWGSMTNPSVSVSSSSTDATNVFMLDGGKLYYVGNQGPAYFSWGTNDNKLITIGDDNGDRFTLYKVTIKNYVKWKRVDGNKVKLNNNEEVDVVIVDLKTGKAMSNDKGDKDPAAVAVTLNDDLDRIIMDEVPDNVQWKCNKVTVLSTTFITFKTEDGKNLYADTSDKVLKVGDAEEDNKINFYFSIADKSLYIPIDSKNYRCYSDDSMFSNVWKLGKEDEDKPQNAQIAIFKKVEDPQKIVKIELPEYYNYDLKNKDQYTLYERDFNEKVTITGAEKTDINWSSSKSATEIESAVDINQQGTVTLNKRGTTVITAYVEEDTENYTHDKASAKCTVIVDDSGTAEPGSKNLPLTVAEAKELAETGHVTHDGEVYLTWEEGVNYYIKGKVSKVNSGMMAMFGDMDFGEMMGGSGSEDSMDDMDFDPEDMEESGFDMSSFDMSSFGFDMSAMFGTSDKVTYYISDDGTKDGQMKVINGCGTLSDESTGGTMVFNPIPKLSPGDCVVVCGPLVNTEDTNMFSGMMGGNSSEEPKMSGKVDEMNYLAVYDPTLLIDDKDGEDDNKIEIYVNKTLDGQTVYKIDNLFDRFNEKKIPETATIEKATFKSSDEDIAKCEESEDKTTTIITGVNEGKAKITVKVKVVLPKREGDDEDKERSYTMKRKFKLIVKTRDLDPAGYYDGEWKLTTSTDDLEDGTRLVLVGTRVKDDKATDYMMVENNAMMGGGKNGSKIEFDEPTIPSSTVTSKKGLEVILEKDGDLWKLNVGKDENDTPLYLYATAKKSDEESNDMMEMFMSSTGLKVGTEADALAEAEPKEDEEETDILVSLKANISISNDIATISFVGDGFGEGKKNTIMLSSSFDMEEMMGMFGGNNSGGGNSSSSSSFDMGSFDMFMASFNTKKPGDEQPTVETVDEETQETKAPKCFMPRIYRFVPYESYNITIGSTKWRTIVSYKDVSVPDNVEAYIVTKVTPKETQSEASLKPVKELKGGEPYLLHSTSGNYTLTLLTPNVPDELEAPKGNLLLKSDRKTAGTKDGSTVYVLANKSLGVGFYRWTGDDLGAGRVYLPVGATVAGAHEYCGFIEDGTTAILSIDDFKANVGPFYDMQGRRVDNPSKGIYIVNGKKVIVK